MAIYRTRQGDTWDAIAHKQLDDVNYTDTGDRLSNLPPIQVNVIEGNASLDTVENLRDAA